MSRQSRYREIEGYLRTLVEAARPGDPLPSEAELCERFSVSRMTVRQALAELTNDGLVERRRGQGTFVTHRPVHRRPGVFLSFTEEMHRRGAQATSRLLSAGLDDPRRPEAEDLGLAPGSQLVRVVRVRLADGVPVALEDAALVPELAGVLEEDLGGGSLHSALERRASSRPAPSSRLVAWAPRRFISSVKDRNTPGRRWTGRWVTKVPCPRRRSTRPSLVSSA
ncbi:MAG TPA: GntR family transcriptional regulator, partial [Actinomycetota bacterium]